MPEGPRTRDTYVGFQSQPKAHTESPPSSPHFSDSPLHLSSQHPRRPHRTAAGPFAKPQPQTQQARRLVPCPAQQATARCLGTLEHRSRCAQLGGPGRGTRQESPQESICPGKVYTGVGTKQERGRRKVAFGGDLHSFEILTVHELATINTLSYLKTRGKPIDNRRAKSEDLRGRRGGEGAWLMGGRVEECCIVQRQNCCAVPWPPPAEGEGQGRRDRCRRI